MWRFLDVALSIGALSLPIIGFIVSFKFAL